MDLKKVIGWILFVIVIAALVLIVQYFIFYLSPTKTTVDNFLKDNSCNLGSIKTDYFFEDECASYLRRHTTIAFGQIYNNPPGTLLFVYTPFRYFNYVDLEPNAFDSHVYLFVITRDEGALVYNPVNGSFIDSYDNLMLNMGCNINPNDDLYIANQKCNLNSRSASR